MVSLNTLALKPFSNAHAGSAGNQKAEEVRKKKEEEEDDDSESFAESGSDEGSEGEAVGRPFSLLHLKNLLYAIRCEMAEEYGGLTICVQNVWVQVY